MDVLKFKNIVNSLSKRFSKKEEDKEDIAQDLWIKLLTLSDGYLPDNEEESYKMVKSILKNYLINFKRKKDPLLSVSNIDEIILSEINLCIKAIQEEGLNKEELEGVVMKWAKEQGGNMHTFITELLNPSPLVRLIYLNSSGKRGLNNIPPYSLAKALNMNQRIWRKKSLELSLHLRELNYL